MGAILGSRVRAWQGYMSMKASLADMVTSVYTARRKSILTLNFLFKVLKGLPGSCVCT